MNIEFVWFSDIFSNILVIRSSFILVGAFRLFYREIIFLRVSRVNNSHLLRFCIPGPIRIFCLVQKVMFFFVLITICLYMNL